MKLNKVTMVIGATVFAVTLASAEEETLEFYVESVEEDEAVKEDEKIVTKVVKRTPSSSNSATVRIAKNVSGEEFTVPEVDVEVDSLIAAFNEEADSKVKKEEEVTEVETKVSKDGEANETEVSAEKSKEKAAKVEQGEAVVEKEKTEATKEEITR